MDNIVQKDFNPAEYAAFRQWFGMMVVTMDCGEKLMHRIKMTKNTYRDYKLILALLPKVMAAIQLTTPPEKWDSIDAECRNTECTINTVAPYRYKPERHQYVESETMCDLLSKLRTWECLTCDKKGKQLKNCPLRKQFNKLIPYSVEREDGLCPWTLWEGNDVDL